MEFSRLSVSLKADFDNREIWPIWPMTRVHGPLPQCICHAMLGFKDAHHSIGHVAHGRGRRLDRDAAIGIDDGLQVLRCHFFDVRQPRPQDRFVDGECGSVAQDRDTIIMNGILSAWEKKLLARRGLG